MLEPQGFSLSLRAFHIYIALLAANLVSAIQHDFLIVLPLVLSVFLVCRTE